MSVSVEESDYVNDCGKEFMSVTVWVSLTMSVTEGESLCQ